MLHQSPPEFIYRFSMSARYHLSLSCLCCLDHANFLFTHVIHCFLIVFHSYLTMLKFSSGRLFCTWLDHVLFHSKFIHNWCLLESISCHNLMLANVHVMSYTFLWALFDITKSCQNFAHIHDWLHLHFSFRQSHS